MFAFTRYTRPATQATRHRMTTWKPRLEALETRTLLDGTVVDVDIGAPWRDTGIDVVAGQQLLIKTEPSATVSFGWGSVNADGVGSGFYGTAKGGDSVLPDAIFLSLIGKVGGTTDIGTGTSVPEASPGKGPGFVGSSYSHVMSTSGRLFLGFNDNIGYFFDNSGSFHTTVQLDTVDLVPTFDNSVLHKLLYRGQTLSVPLGVMNQGVTTASGTVNIEYYLSTSQNPDLNGLNIPLRTLTNQPLNIPAGQSASIPASVIMPTDLVTGMYWLKAKLIPVSVQDGNLSNNLAVSDSLTACSDSNSMIGPRAKRFEAAVSTAKNGPYKTAYDFLPTEAATQVFSDEETQRYIQYNEERGTYAAAPYYDKQLIPTIGWGFALQFKDEKGKLVNNPEAKDRIKAANLVYNGKKLNYEDVLKLTDTGAKILPKSIADQWFSDDYTSARRVAVATFGDFSEQPLIQSVLIDMSYNLGPTKLPKFTGMIAAVQRGDVACAGFEMMDSLWADQVDDRATRDFLILLSGHESEL